MTIRQLSVRGRTGPELMPLDLAVVEAREDAPQVALTIELLTPCKGGTRSCRLLGIDSRLGSDLYCGQGYAPARTHREK